MPGFFTYEIWAEFKKSCGNTVHISRVARQSSVVKELTECYKITLLIHRANWRGIYRRCGGERADSGDEHSQRRARTHIARVQLPTATTTRLQRAFFQSPDWSVFCAVIGQLLCAVIAGSRSEFDAESTAAMFCISLIIFTKLINK